MNLIRRSRSWADPFDLLSDFQEEMNRALATSLTGRTGENALSFAPEMDVLEEENQYLVKTDLPGLRKEDIDISVVGNVLTLKGERKEESEKKDKHAHYVERRFGSFQRVFEFPTEVDASQVKATYKEGVLELIVPKSEKAKPKQIKIDVK